ncbi:hypothetical protein RHMOL_Rhmol06G0099400 [Rhododendron molle]|uniref:Uncharacterized protein n=1 Tax=Rhododendron molle TaxID=49168 RepID=A0ACC0NBU4_RHOML|nr:hypothetical protein RHMOL_Rhmol06G0099400 [Rhododendron molle]
MFFFIISMAHRRWREEEEDTLLTNLTSLVDQGVWRTNNGHFKPSYLGVLTNEMRVSFPLAGINEIHIEAKIKKWKSDYHILDAMLRRPGITDFRDISGTSNFPILIDGPIALFFMRTRSSKFKAGIGRIN